MSSPTRSGESGYDVKSVFVLGLQPYIHYGAEAMGLGPKQLQSADWQS